MRALMLSLLFAIVPCLAAQANGIDWDAYKREKYEKARDAALEKRRKELEADQAEKLKPKGIDWFVVGFIGLPLGFVVLAVVAVLIWRVRSPQVHCPRCHWSGRETEASVLGLTETTGEMVVGHLLDHVVPLTSVALEVGKAMTGERACPRCGAHPLIDAREMPAPRPPRKGVRPNPLAGKNNDPT